MNAAARVFNRQIGGLHAGALILAFFTFLSQILGLVRDRLFAGIFGASQDLDIYYAAFTIPDLLFALAASVVSLSVLIPFLSQARVKGHETAGHFIDDIFSVFSVLILLVSIVAFIFMPLLSRMFFPGFEGEAATQLTLLSRFLLISPVLLGLSNIITSVTQVTQRFFLYALSPIAYNFGIILGVLFLAPYFGVAGVVMGVALGALGHVAVQLPTLRFERLKPTLTRVHDWPRLRRLLKLSLPRALALSVSQIGLLILIGFASRLSEGSIAIFTFAFNLQSVPLAIIGVSYSIAAFPMLSRLFAEGRLEEFKERVSITFRFVLFWCTPAVVIFIILRAHIVRVILGTGAFGWEATLLTAASLAIFAISVIGQSLVLLFARAYYAAGRTWKPFLVSTFGVSVMIAGAYLLTIQSDNVVLVAARNFIVRTPQSGSEVLLLVGSYTAGFTIAGFILTALFIKDFSLDLKPIRKAIGHISGTWVIAGATMFWLLRFFSDLFGTTTAPSLLLQGGLAAFGGILVAIGLFELLRNREYLELKEQILMRLSSEGNMRL